MANTHAPNAADLQLICTLDSIMDLVQTYASTWSSVGGPFDKGDMLADAESAKIDVRVALVSAVKRLTLPGLNSVLDELERATRKFPTWPDRGLDALAILGEEFGELNRAMLQMVYEPHKVTAEDIRTEAIQTAAMALRLIMSLDRYTYTPSQQHSQKPIYSAD